MVPAFHWRQEPDSIVTSCHNYRAIIQGKQVNDTEEASPRVLGPFNVEGGGNGHGLEKRRGLAPKVIDCST